MAASGSLLLAGCVVRERTVYRTPPPGVAVAPGAEVDVNGPPPDAPPAGAVVETDTTVAPAPGMIWVTGYWGWGPAGWVWVGGHWGRPPHPGAIWIGPRYVYRGGRHVWVRGYWR